MREREALRARLAPILSDVASTTGFHLNVDFDRPHPDYPGSLTCWISTSSEGAAGFSVVRVAEEEQTVMLADQIQELVIEELWSRRLSASWPECPTHRGHPLRSAVVETHAVWQCPQDSGIRFPIGGLSPS